MQASALRVKFSCHYGEFFLLFFPSGKTAARNYSGPQPLLEPSSYGTEKGKFTCAVRFLPPPQLRTGGSYARFFSWGKTPKRDKHHPPHFPRFPVGRRGTPNWDRTSLTIIHPSSIPKLFPPIFPLSESSILRISLRGPMGNHCASANFWMLKKAPPGTCRVPPHNEDRAGGVGRYPPARSPPPENRRAP